MATISSDQIFTGRVANTPYDITVSNINRTATDVWGLKHRPSLEPTVSDDQDSPGFGSPNAREEVSDCNISVVREIVKSMGQDLTSMLEIGVNRNGERSMSRVLMDERPEGSFYLGVDIDDKSYLDDPAKNTWTICCNSHATERVAGFMHSKGIKQIDLLFIDGWHSVNTCVNDWQYTRFLSQNGVVIMHDTNSHPGPIALFEAINEDLYDKQRYCTSGEDFGIAVAKRKA